MVSRLWGCWVSPTDCWMWKEMSLYVWQWMQLEDMPVIVGTSHAGTRSDGGTSARAESLGASGVMVTPSKEPTPMVEDRLQNILLL